MEKPRQTGYSAYSLQADELLRRYDSGKSEDIHSEVLSYFPERPGSVLDVGAGSGRDAAYFAARGHQVVAVEPARAMRQGAQVLHADSAITWIDDALPELSVLLALGKTFDFVLLIAVWMHLDAEQRAKGMESLSRLTHGGSRIVMSLRHGPVPAGRLMFEVGAEETVELAARHGFTPLYNQVHDSKQVENRAVGVRWTRLVLERRRRMPNQVRYQSPAAKE